MNKSYIPEVAKMLGVEIGEKFDVIDENGDSRGWNSHEFTEEMMVDCMGNEAKGWLVYYLLKGEYTLKKRPWKPKMVISIGLLALMVEYMIQHCVHQTPMSLA